MPERSVGSFPALDAGAARPLPFGGPVPEPPTLAFFAAFLGGVLIVVEGLALLAGGTEPIMLVTPPASSELPSLGGVGVATGIGILALGFSLQENLGHRVGVGIALVVLGLLSVASGGGFLLGTGLAVAGGLLAVVRQPTLLYHHPGDWTPRRSTRQR